jgi:hypothetical protein
MFTCVMGLKHKHLFVMFIFQGKVTFAISALQYPNMGIVFF